MVKGRDPQESIGSRGEIAQNFNAEAAEFFSQSTLK